MINNISEWDSWEKRKFKPYFEHAINAITTNNISKKVMADLAGGCGRCQKWYSRYFDIFLLHDQSSESLKNAKRRLKKAKPKADVLELCCNQTELKDIIL